MMREDPLVGRPAQMQSSWLLSFREPPFFVSVSADDVAFSLEHHDADMLRQVAALKAADVKTVPGSWV